jgi:uncharacterized protein
MVKKEIRILGFDDSPFDKFRDEKVLVVGAFYRGGQFLDGVVSGYVKVDGSDSTSRLISLLKKSKFLTQLRAVMLDGIAMGGFNVVDITRICRSTGLPVIVVMRGYPDIEKMTRALVKIGQGRKALLMKKAGRIYRYRKIHFQVCGMSPEEAREVLSVSITHSEIPEALRVAHLIAGGIVKGESRGRA